MNGFKSTFKGIFASKGLVFQMENIGPLTMSSSGELGENPHAWSDDYNVMVIDNPVGSGFSGPDMAERSGSYIRLYDKRLMEEVYATWKYLLKNLILQVAYICCHICMVYDIDTIDTYMLYVTLGMCKIEFAEGF